MPDIQKTLFDRSWRQDLLERVRAAAPHNRTDTSVHAAERIRPRAGTKRAVVLEAIERAGGDGATIDEIAQATGFLTQTVCGRIAELRQDGWIQDSGRRRQTRHGANAIVWIRR